MTYEVATLLNTSTAEIILRNAVDVFAQGAPGQPGATGASPVLTLEVDFVAAGIAPSAVQSGTVANPVLTLTIPQATQHTGVYTFGSPVTSWPINHNLGRYPSTTVVDTAEEVLIADIEYVDSNNILVTFGSPTAGTAYLN